MTEEESLLVRIKFIINMYNSGVTSAGSTLDQILDLLDEYISEGQEWNN
ncbi:hypothetical protein [Jeotgalibaca porci]